MREWISASRPRAVVNNNDEQHIMPAVCHYARCAAAVPRTTPRTIDTAITDVIHDELEDVEHFVYTNESPHMYLGLPLPSGIDVISFDGYGKETPLFAPYMYKMHHFTKTGSGQT